MTDTSAHSKTPKKTPLTQTRPEGLSESDLVLVAERLSLIQGHYNAILSIGGVIGGVTVMNEFLLVALKLPTRKFTVTDGIWKIDGKDIAQPTSESEKE